MAIALLSNGGMALAGGEEARGPMHIQRMPKKGNWYRYSGFTGTIGAALAANSELLQFRFVSGAKTYGLVDSVKVDGVGIVAVGTAIGPLGFYLKPARAWSAAGSGGTRIAVSGDNLQMETALNNSQVSDIGIATTGALTAGTKSFDANGIGQVLSGVLTGAATVQQTGPLLSPAYMLNASVEGDMPLVLANQEGFSILTTHAGPTALTYVVGFTVVWCEVTVF